MPSTAWGTSQKKSRAVSRKRCSTTRRLEWKEVENQNISPIFYNTEKFPAFERFDASFFFFLNPQFYGVSVGYHMFRY